MQYLIQIRHRSNIRTLKEISMKKLVFIFLLIILVGCRAEYKDASNDVQFSKIIGATYITLSELKIHGITLDENYQKRIDMYAITELPGFSGPEVVTSSVLKVGSTLKVKYILICTNCLPDRFEIVVDIISKELTPDVQIKLDDLSILNSKKERELNPALFMKVE
jgi:hypothetical protein